MANVPFFQLKHAIPDDPDILTPEAVVIVKGTGTTLHTLKQSSEFVYNSQKGDTIKGVAFPNSDGSISITRDLSTRTPLWGTVQNYTQVTDRWVKGSDGWVRSGLITFNGPDLKLEAWCRENEIVGPVQVFDGTALVASYLIDVDKLWGEYTTCPPLVNKGCYLNNNLSYSERRIENTVVEEYRNDQNGWSSTTLRYRNGSRRVMSTSFDGRAFGDMLFYGYDGTLEECTRIMRDLTSSRTWPMSYLPCAWIDYLKGK